MIAWWKVLAGVILGPLVLLSWTWPAGSVVELRVADLARLHARSYEKRSSPGAPGLAHDLLRARRAFVPLANFLEETLGERGIAVRGSGWEAIVAPLREERSAEGSAAAAIHLSPDREELASLLDPAGPAFRPHGTDFIYLVLERTGTAPLCLEARILPRGELMGLRDRGIPEPLLFPARRYGPAVLLVGLLLLVPLGLALPRSGPLSAPSPAMTPGAAQPVLVFRASVPMLRDPYFLLDLGSLLFFTYAIMVILLGGMMRWQGNEPFAALHGILIWTVAGLAGLFMLIAGTIYRGRHEVEYTIGEESVSLQEVEHTARISRWVRVLAVLGGFLARRPSAIGAGMLARSSLELSWDEVHAVDFCPAYRTVVLRPWIGPSLRIRCPDEGTLREVAQRVRKHAGGAIESSSRTATDWLATGLIALYALVMCIT